jgi:hypothetical protein
MLLGVYPKVDSSHGFPHPYPYEMFRDFQENTLNADVRDLKKLLSVSNRVGSP